MRETLRTLLKIHLVTILMALCLGGNCLLGAAYSTAVFQKRTKGWLGLVISAGTVFISAGFMTGVKYVGVLSVMAAFTVLSRLIGLKEYRCIYLGIAMFLMEISELVFERWQWEPVALAVGFAVGAGITEYFFEKAIQALLNGQTAYLTQQSEAMLSTAWLVGAVTYAAGSFHMPFMVLECAISLLLLYMGYTFGAAMGGTAGAAAGLIMSIAQGNIEYLGVLCFLGLLAGLFKELGRIGGDVALFAGATGLIFCGVSFLTEIGWLLGIVSAGFLWFGYDVAMAYRGKKEARKPEVSEESDGEKDKIQKVAETLEQIASQCLNETDVGFVPEEEQLMELQSRVNQGRVYLENEAWIDVVRLNRLWQMKCLESRETVALQLKETAKLLEQMCRPEKAWKELKQEAEETLYRQFFNLHVETGQMRQKMRPDGRMELQFSCRVRTTSDKQNTLCVMVKELIPVINDYFGKKFQSYEDNKALVGKETAVYRFLESPNFRVLHGSAMAKKETEDTSGDTFGVTTMEDGQVVFSLADGMGTGVPARKESNQTLERLEQLLTSGVPEEMSLRLLNTLQLARGDEQGSTLDFGVLNLNSGVCHLVKAGGAATFIKRNQWVEMIKGKTLPVGMLPNSHFEESIKKLYDGDMIFLVSDGFIQAFPGQEKEEEISRFLMEEAEDNPKEMAGKMMQKALSYGTRDDDMSVLAIGIYQKAG